MATKKRYVNDITSQTHASTEVSQSTPPSQRSELLHSPYLPTVAERLLLFVYPITLLLGSLFSQLSPITHAPWTASIYSHHHQSYQPPELAPSYFATKRNVFNVYFVKVGWFWCSTALAVFTLFAARGRRAIDIGLIEMLQSHGLLARGAPGATTDVLKHRLQDLEPSLARIERDARRRRLYQVALRWIICTAAWAIWTQSLLGKSLIHRIFVATGGGCWDQTLYDRNRENTFVNLVPGISSASSCRRAGGQWNGGVDISGHVFLLMLGSGMLAFEILPVLLPFVRGLTSKRVIFTTTEGFVPLKRVEKDGSAQGHRPDKHSFQTQRRPSLKSYGTMLALTVVFLSWWMLLMTAAFFHTWLEKALACVIAGATLWFVYLCPRGNPLLRSIMGLPGL